MSHNDEKLKQAVKDAGGPVYPINIENHSEEEMIAFGTTIKPMKWNQWGGITLRQHYAIQALAAMISMPDKDDVNRGKNGVQKLAKFAFEYADSMIAEGNEQ